MTLCWRTVEGDAEEPVFILWDHVSSPLQLRWIFCSPVRAAGSLLVSLTCRWLMRVRWIKQRLVERKSCSPDSQTSTCLFSAAVGVSAHDSWSLLVWSANTRVKCQLLEAQNGTLDRKRSSGFQRYQTSPVCAQTLLLRINAAHPEEITSEI